MRCPSPDICGPPTVTSSRPASACATTCTKPIFQTVGTAWWNGKPHLIAQPYVARVESECIYFGGYAHPGHYLGQTLTKLALLNWLPEIKHLPIAVYDNLSQKELDYLDFVGFPAQRRIVVPSSGATRFDAVWMLSSPLRREAKQSRS
jgi:hypothetical protein